MELKICANCGRLHLVDGKFVIIDDVVQPLECKCINPDILSVKDWLEYASNLSYFTKILRKFVKKHNLYEFAFECADEPYCEQYSERIKNAIVDTTHFIDCTKIVEMLINNPSWLKELYNDLDWEHIKNRGRLF